MRRIPGVLGGGADVIVAVGVSLIIRAEWAADASFWRRKSTSPRRMSPPSSAQGQNDQKKTRVTSGTLIDGGGRLSEFAREEG